MLDKRLLNESQQVKGYLAGVASIALMLALLAVFQAERLSHVVSGAFLQGKDLKQLSHYLVWLGLIFLLRAVGQVAGEVLAHEGAARVKSSLREQLLKSLIAKGPLFSREERGGEVLNTLVDGIESLEDYFARYLPQLLQAASIPLLVLGFVFPSDWTSGLILLLTAPLILLFMILIGKLADKKAQKQWEAMSRMGGHFLDVLRGIATLKAFGRSKDQARVVARVSDSFRQATLKVLRVAFLSAFVLELAATISTALVAVALGLRLVNGEIDFQRAFFVLLLAPEVYQPLRGLGVQFHASLSAKSVADRLYQLFSDADQRLTSGEADARLPSGEADVPLNSGEAGARLTAVKANGRQPTNSLEYKTTTFQAFEARGSYDGAFNVLSLGVRGVSYTYPGCEQRVLDQVSFDLKPGEVVVLAGKSGSGKTTLAEILLGFLQPQSGNIVANGVSLKDMSVKAWRSAIAYVPQHPYIFYGTILENLLLGRPDASREAVEQASVWAGAHSFIQALPQGYQTIVGEGGVRLSGGQKQRLALARALLKEAQLLILDEPVSGLDRETEEAIGACLKQWRQGRTVLFISHSRSTWGWADRVFWLEKGVIKAG